LERLTLLIDGDVVAYKAAAAVETEIDWGDDLWTLHSDLDETKVIVQNQIEAWAERFNADRVVFAFSDSHNFRKDIYPLYKANRKGKRKPVAYKQLVSWATETWPTYVRPGLEGDDVLGILSTSETILRGTKIIISVDKDFKTIPGYFFNPDKDTQPVFSHSAEADYMHLYQTLTGDATDGYPGLPGCGPKGAEKVLEEPTWAAVVAAYEKKGLTEEDALIQARCARILRAEDYDFTKKEVKLWLPTA
jgi:DNA polymerase-1